MGTIKAYLATGLFARDDELNAVERTGEQTAHSAGIPATRTV
jgi:hypothetical protein